ncbi:hypothetical protein ACQKP1_13595 [Allorhizobium sp. NPDC080224]|uniref:hypothetical protein n=1 Tax=Allorhizobium sp. NPDC080224 TaxID=3390547 RepID=UPI003D05ACCB
MALPFKLLESPGGSYAMPEPETVAGPIHIASKGVCADRAPIDQMWRNSKVVREKLPHNALVIRLLANTA